MIGHALEELELPPRRGSLLFIENVGNLVCPAAFDLGEHRRGRALLSVTDGDDKPLKYPDMFAAADLMILNKIDLSALRRLRGGALPRLCQAHQPGDRGAAAFGAQRRGPGGLAGLARTRSAARSPSMPIRRMCLEQPNMHELSVAQSLIEMVTRARRTARARRGSARSTSASASCRAFAGLSTSASTAVARGNALRGCAPRRSRRCR